MFRTTRAPVVNSAALAAAALCLGTTAHAAQPGDQIIVKDLIAAKGWTSIVPMNLNGDGPTDMLSYNRDTGWAIYSVAVPGRPGTQTIVKDLIAAKGWSAVVSMVLSGSGSLTGLLSYNAVTGRAIYSAAVSGRPGEQTILRDTVTARGWTSIVPMELNGDGLTDMLSYNRNTGRAVYSVATDGVGTQKVVKDLIAAKGWTAVVPMKLNGDGLTDMLSYNRGTGRAIYAVAVAGQPGTQAIVKDLIAAKGWTAIVPMRLNGDSLTDMLSYNRNTGRAVYSVAVKP